MTLRVKKGSTNVSRRIFVEDGTNGGELTGLLYNSPGLKWYYSKDGDSSETSVPLATAVWGTYTSGGFIECSATNMPGMYEIGVPDTVFTTEGIVTMVLSGATDMEPVTVRFEVYEDKAAYIDGAIWIDTNSANTNTTAYVDGTQDNPVSTWAAAAALSTATGIKSFRLVAGSNLNVTASVSNICIEGSSTAACIVDMSGQSFDDCRILNCTLINDATHTNGSEFRGCFVQGNTFSNSHLVDCEITGTITLTGTGPISMLRCSSHLAVTGCTFDYDTATGFHLHLMDWSGTATIENLDNATSVDILYVTGHAALTLAATCDGGTIYYSPGITITDNGANNTLTAISTSGGGGGGDDAATIWAYPTRSLPSSEHTAMAAAVASDILNDGDGTAVLQAIADQIANDWVVGDASPIAIATLVRDYILDRVLPGNHDTAGTPGKLLQNLDAAVSTAAAAGGMSPLSSGTLQAGSSDGATLAASEPATAEYYQFQRLVLTGGTGAGQERLIMTQNASQVVTVSEPWLVQPDNTTTYEIQPASVKERELLGIRSVTITVDDGEVSPTAIQNAVLYIHDGTSGNWRQRETDASGQIPLLLRDATYTIQGWKDGHDELNTTLLVDATSNKTPTFNMPPQTPLPSSPSGYATGRLTCRTWNAGGVITKDDVTVYVQMTGSSGSGSIWDAQQRTFTSASGGVIAINDMPWGSTWTIKAGDAPVIGANGLVLLEAGASGTITVPTSGSEFLIEDQFERVAAS